MQAEYKGRFLYLYSGREYRSKDPDMNKVGKEDPFATVQCIPVDAITGVEINHSQFTVNLFVKGFPSPIFCSFGCRNCHKINCHTAFVEVISQALSLDREKIWNMNRRNEEVALSSQRKDEMEVE